MYSRSIVDRMKIQFEILCETISDFIRRNSLRTPLLVMAGIAVVMTLKNARASIEVIKNMRGSPFAHKKTNNSFYSPYGKTAGGSNSGGYGRGNYAAPYAGGSSVPGANQFGNMNQNPQYGQQQQFGGMNNRGGMANPNPGYSINRGNYNNQAAMPSYNSGNLRGTAVAAPPAYGAANVQNGSFQTPSLIAKYGASVQSIPAGLFQISSMASFTGQVETASAPDAPGFVDQILRSPGAGKVLVVDSGGSMNSIFDSGMAMVAQQNGWKGVIINGFVLDPPALQTMPFGIKALGSNPNRGMQQMGQRNVPLSIGGVMINPGSWIFADNAGIVISQQNLNEGMGMQGGTMGGQIGGNAMGAGGYTGGMNTMGGGTIAANGMNAQPYGSNTAGMTTPGMTAPGMNMPRSMSQPYGNSAMGGGMRTVNSRNSNVNGRMPTSSQYGSRTSTNSSPFTSRKNPSRYGNKRKRPSKRTLMAMVLFIAAIIWVLLAE